MGRAGRVRVLQRFSNEKVMNDLIALYHELLPRRMG